MVGKFLRMSCRIRNFNFNNTNICAPCNHINHKNEVAFVSPICKTSNTKNHNYRSMGFHVCLDSDKCHERIISIEKLKDILKNIII